MKRFKFLFFIPAVFAGCGRLDRLTWDMTAEKWLSTHPHLPVKFGPFDFILAEPSSTIIVYALGFVIAAAGIVLLRTSGAEKSRRLWGIGLLIWAASTFCAGTSYQAFSYELKCAGRTVCLWTSWWEIWYMILFVISMNVIAAAVAFSSSEGNLRKVIIAYAGVNTAAYLFVVSAGAFIPHRFMASFECMLLFASPPFLILFAVSLVRYMKLRTRLDLLLMAGWLLMFLITAAYFLYYMSGYADLLWERGIWFNANDLLHVGLILWIGYIVFFVAEKVEDAD